MSQQAVPHHVAIIMDGNGRWARARFLPRVFGHKTGAQVARQIIGHASKVGVRYLTLYALSSENRQRPPFEVSQLLGLLREYLKNEIAFLKQDNIRANFIGDLSALGQDVCNLANYMKQQTTACTGMTMTLALNYGSRDEITRAIAAMTAQQDTDLTPYLDTRHLPDPDLIIRTGGEQRLSNFLLWQAAYAELLFIPTLWPEFTSAHFDDALQQYQLRQRRYGKIER